MTQINADEDKESIRKIQEFLNLSAFICVICG